MKLPGSGVLIISAVIYLISSYCFAQVYQPSRFEITLKSNDNYFDVLSAEQNGIIIFRETRERSREGNQWEIIKLDSNLVESWKNYPYFKFEYKYTGYAYADGKFYLLFKDGKSGNKNLQLFVFDLKGENWHQYTIENLFVIDLTHFEVTSNAAILGGYYNLKPVVIHYDLFEQKSKILPSVYNNRTELVQIKINDDDTYSILVNERTKDKRLTLGIKSYSPNGEIIINSSLEPEGDKNIIFGHSATTSSQIQLLAGTYSNRRSNYSRGLFIARIKENGEQNINYYNYADLKNFFSYMKAKRENRVKERINRKKIKGKKLKFNYRLLVHEIIQLDEYYIMLGEAFYPKYSNMSSRTGSVYNGEFQSRSPFYQRNPYNHYGNMSLEGYRYTHAVVIGFDNNGKLLWDNSFEINDVLSQSLDQYVNVSIEEDKIVLLYLHENTIRSKIIRGAEVIEGKSFDNIKLNFQDDVVNNKTAELNGLEKWYDDKFFAYGVQRIKNLRDTGVKLNRKVFFINKLVYQ